MQVDEDAVLPVLGDAGGRNDHPNRHVANRALFDMRWVKRQIGLCIAMVIRIGARALCRESLSDRRIDNLFGQRSARLRTDRERHGHNARQVGGTVGINGTLIFRGWRAWLLRRHSVYGAADQNGQSGYEGTMDTHCTPLRER